MLIYITILIIPYLMHHVSPDELVIAAKNKKQTAVALTDHGSLAGLYEFWKACKKHEIKPIFGGEMYFLTKKKFDHFVSKKEFPKYYHRVMRMKFSELVKNCSIETLQNALVYLQFW